MLDSPKKHNQILELAGIKSDGGELPGHIFRCPGDHGGRNQETLMVIQDGRERLYRCPECGYCLDSMSFVRRFTQFPWDRCYVLSHEKGNFSVATAEARDMIRQAEHFEFFMSAYRDGMGVGRWDPNVDFRRAFGDFSQIERTALEESMPRAAALMRGEYAFASLIRNSIGRVCRARIHSKTGGFIYEHIWDKRDQLLFLADDWAAYTRWDEELIVCLDDAVASAFSQCSQNRWKRRIPVVRLDRIPGRRVTCHMPATTWVVVNNPDHLAVGLLFYDPARPESVRGKVIQGIDPISFYHHFQEVEELCSPSTPECVSAIVKIVLGSPTPEACLHNVLTSYRISNEAKYRVLECVSAQKGVPVPALERELASRVGLYQVIAGNKIYHIQDGRICELKETEDEIESIPVTNFTAQIEQSDVVDDCVWHLVRTNCGKHSYTFRIKNIDFNSGTGLLNRMEQEGCKASMDEHLSVTNPRRILPNLPAIIKGVFPHTHIIHHDSWLGFSRKQFHAPGWIADGSGIHVREDQLFDEVLPSWFTSGHQIGKDDQEAWVNAVRRVECLASIVENFSLGKKKVIGGALAALLQFFLKSLRGDSCVVLMQRMQQLELASQMSGIRIYPDHEKIKVSMPAVPYFLRKVMEGRRRGDFPAYVMTMEDANSSYPEDVVILIGEGDDVPEELPDISPAIATACIGARSIEDAVFRLTDYVQEPGPRRALKEALGEGLALLSNGSNSMEAFLRKISACKEAVDQVFMDDSMIYIPLQIFRTLKGLGHLFSPKIVKQNLRLQFGNKFRASKMYRRSVEELGLGPRGFTYFGIPKRHEKVPAYLLDRISKQINYG